MVSTHLKNIGQIGSFPQVGREKQKYLKPPPRRDLEGPIFLYAAVLLGPRLTVLRSKLRSPSSAGMALGDSTNRLQGNISLDTKSESPEISGKGDMKQHIILNIWIQFKNNPSSSFPFPNLLSYWKIAETYVPPS